MIKTLKLTNFRKHTDSEYNFSQGLQILRGASEAGKTTILEGILYALLGTTALRTSLADTATYGQSESSLKVALQFAFGGVDYTVTRSKSGAEINYAGGSVVGQKETRMFIETLLGCTAEVASAILFADQNAVRGILTAGPTAAGSLVEKLAGLEQLEALISKIQVTLPYGAVVSSQGQLSSAELQAAVEPVKPSDEALVAAQAAACAAADGSAKAEAALEAFDPKLQQAQEQFASRKAALGANAATETRRQKLLQVPHPGVAPCSQDYLERLEAVERDKVEAGYRYSAYKIKFPAVEFVYPGSSAALQEEIALTKSDISKGEKFIQEAKDKVLQTKMLKVNEDVCAFCKKDLTEVPEVQLRNLQIDKDIETLTKIVEAKQQAVIYASERLKTLQQIESVSCGIKNLANPRYWNLTESVPPAPAWIGEAPEPVGDKVDTAGLRKQLALYMAAVATWKTAQERLEELKLVQVPDDTYSEVFKQREVLRQDFEDLKKVETEKQKMLTAARVLHASAVATYEAEVKAKALAQEQVDYLRGLVSEMTTNNELVKKLRGLRPKIASKLWATVLHAVSHYFSQIRGVNCIVTRDDSGFKVDGKGIAGLSGSTLDSLGLAIRLALSRMFLPNVGFMFLDEPASGCDDNRELAMLGVVASSGFPQILLVTHSDVGDSLSQNLVQL